MQVINDTYKFNLLQKLRFLLWIVGASLPCVSLSAQMATDTEAPPAVKVAVASNFLMPMRFLKADFEHRAGYKIKIISASTAKLYAQILNGAPFEVFLAADKQTTQKLLEKGFAVGDSFQYAQGQLVLWTTRAKLMPEAALKRGFFAGKFSRLAIANPKTAPYGRAAMDVLAYYSLDIARSRLVLGESVSQAYQFTGSGNADMGFVSLSQLKTKKQHVSYWLIPAVAYQPIQQYGIIVKQKQRNRGADAFVRYLKSSEVQALLKAKFGYL